MEYVYDDYQRPPSMAERKKRASEFLVGRDDLSPIQTNKKNLAESLLGKHWCWLVHTFVDNPVLLEEGRRIVRAGEIVDHVFSSGVFRCEILVDGRDTITSEVFCDEPGDEVLERLKEQFAERSSDFRTLFSADAADKMRWAIDPGTSVLPSPESIRTECTSADYESAYCVAALYAFGIFLDREPRALFGLQGVSLSDLLAKELESDDMPISPEVEAQFGIEFLDVNMLT